MVRTGEERCAISTLLACGRVHHHLVRTQARTRVGLLLEGAEVRDVHHFCTLIGYGADAICPYLAFESLAALREDGRLAADQSDDALATKYIKVLHPMFTCTPSDRDASTASDRACMPDV